MTSGLRIRQWVLALVAVLGGNALYFWALEGLAPSPQNASTSKPPQKRPASVR